ncbi:MAG: hypothetical protein DRQ39_09530 [Gammaproteobacteria bacterium]|nr:MAG: hypothetical protein DRQ39_09530 [Gammaproteobacteria bacterium]
MPIGNIVGQPLINGVSPAHVDLIINILGTPIVGVTAITYSESQEITPNHSTSPLPTSVGFGIVTPVATLTLTSEAAQALSAIAPGGKIQNIPFFDIGVNFIPEGGFYTRHSLKKCRFKGRDLNSAVGNSQIEETLELFVAQIDWTAN